MAPLSVTSACGIFLLGLASAAGHSGARRADLLFWLGLLTLAVPIALRLLSPAAHRLERMSLLIMLYGGLFADRDLNYPLGFAYNDEFDWFRASQDISTSGHLFHASPLLNIGPFYPGLAIVIAAVRAVTGLPLFGSAAIVLGAAGLLLVLSLYLFFEHVSSSGQAASIATLIYAANPPMSGDIQILYGALAIPLMVFTFFLIAFRSTGKSSRRIAQTVAVWAVLAAVVITHHVTSYEMVGFLVVWTVLFWLLRLDRRIRRVGETGIRFNPGITALVGGALCLAWLAYTEYRAIFYLFPTLDSTTRELANVLASRHSQRHFFKDAAGTAEPRWERYMGFTQVFLIAAISPFGVWGIWRRFRSNAAAIALGVAAAAYPADQLARLAPTGTTTGSRGDAYAYIPVGFVIGVGIVYFFSSRVKLIRYRLPLTGVLTVIFIGGWVLGTSPIWDRLPGPYLVSAQERSIDPEGVQAAEWAGAHLGPGNHIATDRINDLLMGTYGDQWVVQTSNDNNVFTFPVFFSFRVNGFVRTIMHKADIQYVVIDMRLSKGLPHEGFYYDPYEAYSEIYTQPVRRDYLTKFDHVTGISRIFTSGALRIYDVRPVSGR